MSDPFKLRIESEADLTGLEQFEARSEAIFEGVKQGVADALKGEGASPEFIQQALTAFDELKQELDGAGGGVDALKEKLAALERTLADAMEKEQRRIATVRAGMEEALRDKDLQEEALALARRRKEEDQLHAEQEAREARLRIAEKQIQLELERSVAQARQMSAEQAIERDVRSQGAYDPKEEVQRLKAVETQTGRNAAAQRGLKSDIGGTALVFAQFADDAQYGLRAVTGQIPQLIAALGLGTGVAGVIGLAAVAINLLWDKFSGASKAKQDSEDLKKTMDGLTESINESATASREAFTASMEVYLEQLKQATQLWSGQKQQIQEAARFVEEMAKAELDAAKAKLEISRQNELLAAKTQADREAINSRYDFAGGMMERGGKEAALQRAEEVKKSEIVNQKARTGDAEGAKAAAEQSIANIDAQNQEIISGIGRQSDQQRRRNAAIGAEAGVNGLDALNRPLTEKENERRNKWIAEREAANLTKAEDEAALRTGKGLTFDQAKEASKTNGDAASLKKYTEAEEQLKANTEARAKLVEQMANADKEIFNLKLEAQEMEKRLLLLQKQQQAARLAAVAEETKQAADEKAKVQKQAEEDAKKQQAEQKLALENEARRMEMAGNATGAAEKRNQADLIGAPEKGPLRDKINLDAQERLNKAKPTEINAGDQVMKLTRLSENLGPAGVELGKATAKMADGADAKELAAVAKLLEELTPLIVSRFDNSEKKIGEMKQQLADLKLKLRGKES